MGESLHRDMVAVPLGGPLTVAVVASPDYLQRVPAPRHPDELVRHNCVRVRFVGTGRIYKWEFQVDGQLVEYEIKGNLTITDTVFSLDAALDGIESGLHLRATGASAYPSQAAEAGVDPVLADFSRLLSALLEQARPANEIEGAD